MHLISALAAGIGGAENGTAEIYVRGTSTRATLYDDFEASSSNSSGADVTLDAYGGAIIYVSQLVDVVVKADDGTAMREFVAGSEAPNVEVRSTGFTGADYVTAQRATSSPTTLQTVLDLWFDNAGAPDWKVLVNGSDTTLLNALGAIGGIVYNVRSPEFGAEGDAVTNERAAFQAAHDAALAAGGGLVVVPPGTYLFDSKVVWSTSVSLFAVPGAVEFRSSINGDPVISIEDSASNDCPTVIFGVEFTRTGAAAGPLLEITHSASDAVTVARCVFTCNPDASGNAIYITAADCPVTVEGCRITVAHASANGVYSNTSLGDGSLRVSDCNFEASVSLYSGVFVQATASDLFASENTFDYANIASGNPVALYLANTNRSLVAGGNNFKASGGIGYAVRLLNGGDYHVADSNAFGSLTRRYYRSAGTEMLASKSYLALKQYSSTNGGAAPTLDSETRSLAYRGTSTVPTFTMPDILVAGQLLTVMVRNASGVAWGSAPTFTGAEYSTSIGVASLSAGQTAALTFVASDLITASTYVWRAVSAA